MMYRCRNGHEFEKPYVNGFDWACGCEDQVCPICKTDEFEEVFHCIKCGEYYLDEDMIGSICRGCVEKRATRPTAYAYCMECHDDPSDLDGMTDEQIKAYCFEDVYDFSEFLEGQDDDDN